MKMDGHKVAANFMVDGGAAGANRTDRLR